MVWQQYPYRCYVKAGSLPMPPVQWNKEAWHHRAQQRDAAPPGHLNAGRYTVPPSQEMRTGSQGSWERCFLRLGNTPCSKACLETQCHMQHSAVASLQLGAATQLVSPAAGAGPGPQTEAGDGAWEHESCPDSIWLDRSGYSSWRSDPRHTNPAWTI